MVGGGGGYEGGELGNESVSAIGAEGRGGNAVEESEGGGKSVGKHGRDCVILR